jgi:ribosomal protein L11 methylase PrmA
MRDPAFLKVPPSFRDPSGFVFKKDGVFYRQVNEIYRENYDQLMTSGLYSELTESGLMIKHKEIENEDLKKPAYKILEPDQILFISYPYEWCFTQLKEAALLTLKIQTLALEHGMSLKDASAYNIQFAGGKPVFIDTLSFERYQENKPWVAYRQFCQHFLAPLALISRADLRLGSLSQSYLDGIPLDLAASLLPFKTRFSFGIAAHIHLHARSQKKYSDTDSGRKNRHFSLSKNRLFGILENLKSTVNSLHLLKQATEWGNYYNDTNYTSASAENKREIIEKWLRELKPKSVWDAGANDATFSRLASKMKIFTVATDIDPQAVEKAYQRVRREKDEYLLPLILNFANPSPAIGWLNKERDSFLGRGRFDLAFCLAFVHHLAITNNLPLAEIADLFRQHALDLIIEFVPKNDSNARRLLLRREDIFTGYNQENFEKEFSRYFIIKERVGIKESSRFIYLMQKK